MNITFHQLESLLVIEECGSFSKAAEQMFVTPAALIQQINSLEKQLDIRLFQRTNHGLITTPAGKLFCAYAKCMTDDFNDFVERCRVTQETQKTIRIASDMRKNQLDEYYDCILKFSAQNPQVGISYVDLESESVIDNYSRDLYDFCVYAVDAQIQQEQPFICTHRSRLGIVMAPNHRLASKNVLSAADLSGETVALYDMARRPSAVRWCSINPQCRLISVASTHEKIMRHCLNSGLFLLPEYSAGHLPHLIFKPLDTPLMINHGLVYHHSSLNDRFAEYIRKLDFSAITASE